MLSQNDAQSKMKGITFLFCNMLLNDTIREFMHF